MSNAYTDFSLAWARLRELEYMKIEILDEKVVTDIGVFNRGDQVDTFPKELRNQLLDSGRASMVCDIPPDMAKLIQAQDEGKSN